MNAQHEGTDPEMRARIVLYLRVLDKAGFKQKDISKKLTSDYGLKVTEITISKVKKDAADYPISLDKLSEMLKGLSKWLLDLLNNREYAIRIDGLLRDEGITPAELRRQHHEFNDQSRVMEDSSVMKGDIVLSFFNKFSIFETMFIFLCLYLFLPYIVAIVSGTWASAEYAFSESNTMLLGYPVFAMSVPIALLFYKSVPDAFNGFSRYVNSLESYAGFMDKSLLKHLTPVSIFTFITSFLVVLFLHINYLEDDKQSFLEIEKGQPSFFFFLNICLFSVQVFIFMYVLIVFGLSTMACYKLSKDSDANCQMMRGKVPAVAVRPFMLITRYLIIWLACSLIYGISFGTTVSNFSKKHAEVSFWHKLEAMMMYLPFGIYVLPLSVFVYSVYKLVLKDDLEGGFRSFIAIL